MARKTYIELQQEIAKLQREAEEAREVEISGAITKINEVIAVYGLSPDDLRFSRSADRQTQPSASDTERGRRALAATGARAKYRDSKGNTWGGRGPRPLWLRTALKSGKMLDEFRV